MLDRHHSGRCPPCARAALLLTLATACAPPVGVAPATEVVESPGASGQGFGDPSRATNGVRGGGRDAQSLDVYSIPPEEHLTLGWDERWVMDGPGDDLVVFENAFEYSEGQVFMDPTIVEVSEDGERWHAFEHDYLAEDEHTYSARPGDWSGFAGTTPVLLDDDAPEPLDPFDERAGGDRFDLATLGLSQIRFVRLRAASAVVNPDTSAPYVRDPVSDGADIDGVYARDVSP